MIGEVIRLLGLEDKIFGRKEAKKKPGVIRNLVSNPEKYKLEAWINGDEIEIHIRKREDFIEAKCIEERTQK